MRTRILACLAATGLLLGLIGTGTASADKLTAELIDVHHIKPAIDHERGGNGKGRGPGGDDGGETASCTNDDPSAYTGKTVPTGWLVEAKTAVFNTSSAPGGLGNLVASAQAAFDAWGNGVPAITVVGGGTSKRSGANRTDELMFGRTGNSIATTYTWRWSDGWIESDVVFNKGLPWFNPAAEGDGCIEDQAKYDFTGIAAHEFGHVYGLDHPAGARFETMYAYGYTGETLKRSPTSGEKAGLAALYS